MPEHIPFPEIQQFRNTIRTVKERAEHDGVPLPTLTFVGSVKLHGTNASVVFPAEGGFYCQSRSQIITPEADNAGFAKWANENEDAFQSIRRRLFRDFPLHTGFVVYGEWCGQGIQKGVAISQVTKRFVVFAISVLKDGTRDWVLPVFIPELVEPLLPCIYDYPTWNIEIDFNKPEDSQNRLIELTQAVESECPVGRSLGVSGVGEGIVWWPLRSDFNTHGLAFKVKGEKHSESKVKTLAAVDVERLESIKELVDTVLTEHRLEKKLESLEEQGHPVDIKSTGAFLKIVGTDVWKEEQDTIDASGFERNEIMGAIQKKAKQWWMEKLSK